MDSGGVSCCSSHLWKPSHAHLDPQQQPGFQVEAQSLRITHPHPGTRFLKDAMWKRDKKDFACEMGKLKRLKSQLAFMEQHYQTEYQVRGRVAEAPGTSCYLGM